MNSEDLMESCELNQSFTAAQGPRLSGHLKKLIYAMHNSATQIAVTPYPTVKKP